MNFATVARTLTTVLAVLLLVFNVSANDPIFVKWLVIDDPGDETIRTYWENAEAGELSAEELVDLGTMLFYKGWSSDAVGYFRQALELDPALSDAWFRIGLVNHHGGDLDAARSAYKKCLKLQSGHAWGNFYLALLEEQNGEAKSAMQHYETAFKHAPELADPRVNPEVLSSRLQLGAQVRHFDSGRFQNTMPMSFLDPAAVRQVRRQYEKEPPATPTPIPEPEALIGADPTTEPSGRSGGGSRVTTTRQSGGTTSGGTSGSSARSSRGRTSSSGGGAQHSEDTPYGVPAGAAAAAAAAGSGGGGGTATPQIGETSPEASLHPIWPELYQLAAAVL